MGWIIVAPGAGAGGGGVSNPDAGQLLDGEMTRFNQGTGEMEGSGDINTDTEVDFGTKDIVTTGIVNAGSGTFILGEAIADSSAGENKTTTNLVSGKHFNPVWIQQDENFPTARITIGAEQIHIQESSKADILINPSWQSDPLVDWRVVKLTLEVDTTITNVVFNVNKGGSAFYTARLGTLTANVETTIDLSNTTNNVPAEAFVGDVYDVSVTSVDGDVRCKGSTANSLPFFKVGYFEFEDKPVALEESVPTVSVEEFASTNARFFGELGVPGSQTGWIDSSPGATTIDLVLQTVFGIPNKQVVRHNDDAATGATSSDFILTAQNWLDINAFGASYGGTSRLDTVNGGAGFFSGLQADGAENPLGPLNRRYGVFFDTDGGNLSLTEADNLGNTVTMDGTGGNPLVPFDVFFKWECLVPAALGAAQVLINGVLTTFSLTFGINGGGADTACRVSSGSTGGTNRVVYHDNFGVTIFEESASKTLSSESIGSDTIQELIPEGRRDYTVTLPDGNPRKVGDRIDFTLQNAGGVLTVKAENLLAPEAIFSGLSEIKRGVSVVTEIRIVNTVANGNVYVGFIDEVAVIPIRTVSKSTILTLNDSTIIGDDNFASLIMTLPTATGIAGRTFTVKKLTGSGNNVVLNTIGAETINGVNGITLTLINESATVQSDGANWHVIASV